MSHWYLITHLTCINFSHLPWLPFTQFHCLFAAFLYNGWNRVNIVIIGTFSFSGKLSADKLRLKLNSAMKKNDPDLLEKVITECVGSGHSELMPDIQEARIHLESLEESGRGLSRSLILFIEIF